MNEDLGNDIHIQGDLARRLQARAAQRSQSVEALLEEWLLQDELPLYDAIQSLSVGVLIADARRPHMPLVFVNRALEAMTQYQETEIVGQHSLLNIQDHSQEALETMHRALKQGIGCDVMRLSSRKDGSTYWSSLHLAPVRNANHSLTHYIGIQRDITEQIGMAEALRENEERYRLTTEMMTDYAFSIRVEEDGNLYPEWFTPSFERVTGYSMDSHMDGEPLQLSPAAHPDDLQRAENDIRTMLQTGQPNISEYRIRRTDGNYVWLRISRRPIIDPISGRVTRFYGAAKDITEQKAAELQLLQSEARFRLISEITSDYAFVMAVQPDGTLYREWITGPSMERITGYTPEESAARGGWSALAHPEDMPILFRDINRLLSGPVQLTTHYRIIAKDGRYVHMQGFSRSIADESGKVTHIYAAARDITNEVIAEQQRRESEARFETMADSAPVLIWVTDNTGACTYFNTGWLEFTGRSMEEEKGAGWSQGVHPEDVNACLKDFTSAFHKRVPFKIEYRLRRHDGEYRWISDQGMPRYAPDGTFTGYVGSAIDISDMREAQALLKATNQELERRVAIRTQELYQEIEQRRQTSDALRRERDLLEKTIRTSPAAIFLVNHSGEIIYASSRAETIFGIAQDRLVGRKFNDPMFRITDLNGRPIPDDELPFRAVMRTCAPVNDMQHVVYDHRGQAVILSINGAPIFSEDGTVLEVVFTAEDITLRKQWEVHMQQALEHEREMNRLKSNFISIVSHEFKTPLTVIGTSTQLMRMKDEMMSADERRVRLDRIDEQVQRLAELIDDILQLSRSEHALQKVEFKPVHLPTFFDRVVAEIHTAYGDAIPISTEYRGCESGNFDEDLLHQIFSNLLSNAVKYSRPGGSVRCHYHCENDTFVMTVSDQGIGIPEAEQPMMFKPFQRASNVGSIPGSGVGLVVVQQAVDAHHGVVEFTSVVNQGTRFTVRLPHLP